MYSAIQKNILILGIVACFYPVWTATTTKGTTTTTTKAPVKANYSIISIPIPGLYNPTNPPSGFIPDVIKEMAKIAGFNYYFANIGETGFGRMLPSGKFDGAMGQFILHPEKYDIYASLLENQGPYEQVVDFLTPLFQSNVTTVYNMKRALPSDIISRTVGYLEKVPVVGSKLAQGAEDILSYLKRVMGEPLFNTLFGFFNFFFGSNAGKQNVNTVLVNQKFWEYMETAVLDLSETFNDVHNLVNDPSKLRDPDTWKDVRSTITKPGSLVPRTYDQSIACVKRDDGNQCRFIGRTPVIDNEIVQSNGKLGKDVKTIRPVWGSFSVHKAASNPKITPMIKSLNTAIRTLIDTKVIEKLYTQYFPYSVFTRPVSITPYWKSKAET
ncbi:uncharacterized protein LOC129586060 [Paramacrobiotus metropolitanus]|uniref:uncharacterized protein LOC129586060 n=1 Tax=Paramacrobiotus metropolitanus TaxID=2943436 RepID=UPI002445EE8B|nr:uncharacterized protein LOC129586060 [Paramacrobiotus metropolitanus]